MPEVEVEVEVRKPKKDKKKKLVRTAAGETWEDPSLEEWENGMSVWHCDK